MVGDWGLELTLAKSSFQSNSAAFYPFRPSLFVLVVSGHKNKLFFLGCVFVGFSCFLADNTCFVFIRTLRLRFSHKTSSGRSLHAVSVFYWMNKNNRRGQISLKFWYSSVIEPTINIVGKSMSKLAKAPFLKFPTCIEANLFQKNFVYISMALRTIAQLLHSRGARFAYCYTKLFKNIDFYFAITSPLYKIAS